MYVCVLYWEEKENTLGGKKRIVTWERKKNSEKNALYYCMLYLCTTSCDSPTYF